MSGRIVSDMERVKQLNRVIKAGAHSGDRVTVHRYHPSQPLGGPLHMLDFGKPYVTDLIQRGLEDARAHNCEESGGVIASAPKALAMASANC